jgi:hypothetical protein
VHDVDVTQTGGLVMASHLVQVGATVVVGMEEGKWHAVVGQGGTVTAGYDFPIEGGKGCAINMLTPTAITMEGTPRGFPIETAAAPASGPGPVWAFVVAGEVADAALLPDGTGLRVLNTRSGEHVDAPVEMNGAFLAALINDQQRPVVMEGDVLRFEFVTPKGHLFSRVAEQRVTRTDLRRAFTRVAASARPESNRLLPNYPNPFNPETWIPFELREAAQVTITIYDAAGSVLRTLDLGHQTPGMYTTPERAAYWNGRNEDGEIVGSGVYFVEMVAGDYRQIRRIGLLK